MGTEVLEDLVNPIIILLKHEYERGISVGRDRQQEDDLRNLKTKFEANKDDKFRKHEIGALCELAFWKFRFPGRPWRPAGLKGVDVGEFQVRGAVISDKISLEECKLIIRPWDYAGDRIAMVIRVLPTVYVIRGWIEVGEGRRIGRPWNPNGYGLSYLVDQSRLNTF